MLQNITDEESILPHAMATALANVDRDLYPHIT